MSDHPTEACRSCWSSGYNRNSIPHLCSERGPYRHGGRKSFGCISRSFDRRRRRWVAWEGRYRIVLIHDANAAELPGFFQRLERLTKADRANLGRAGTVAGDGLGDARVVNGGAEHGKDDGEGASEAVSRCVHLLSRIFFQRPVQAVHNGIEFCIYYPHFIRIIFLIFSLFVLVYFLRRWFFLTRVGIKHIVAKAEVHHKLLGLYHPAPAMAVSNAVQQIRLVSPVLLGLRTPERHGDALLHVVDADGIH
mmetsp:Transcript_24012/g.70844  ORF Transcript_24012/g.70844 Transcript_24012/m.70844 type:complete len:250 (-) Transcript_24012:562-1311(-)